MLRAMQFFQSLKRFDGTFYAVLRIVTGALFFFHGFQKIFHFKMPIPALPVGSQLWFGGIIELVCGVLIAFGFFTRPAAFLAAGTMAVAYFQFHWKLETADYAWLPAINQGESAVVYCFLFLYMAARGSGTIAALKADS
jgi:putative oxidoreductase